MASAGFCLLCYAFYGNRHQFFDLHIYVDALSWWRAGHDLYGYARPDDVQGALYFTYTPFAALVMLPAVAFPFGVVAVALTAVSVGLLILTTSWVSRAGWRVVGVVTPLLLITEPIRENLTLGQINIALVALVLFDFCHAIPRRRRYAGVAIGLAAAIKLVPAVFIVYLAATRRWRPFVVSSAAAAGATLLAAAVALRESRFYWTDAFWDTSRVGHTFYTANQSINGLLGRLAAPAEPNRLLWAALAAALAIVGFGRAVRAHRLGNDLTGVTLVGLTSALVSPITWPHHMYWFLPALMLLGVRARVVLYAVLVWGVVSFLTWGSAEAEPTTDLRDFLLRNSLAVAALVLVLTLPLTGRFFSDRVSKRAPAVRAIERRPVLARRPACSPTVVETPPPAPDGSASC